MDYLSKKIVAFAREHTSSDIKGMNDGFALASVSGAMLTALFLAPRGTFLGVLQHSYHFGDDTDTVGAMLGALLGAFAAAGNPHNMFPEYLPRLLVEAKSVLATFDAFVRCALGEHPNDQLKACASFIVLEVTVTQRVLGFSNGKRNPHFNSKEQGKRIDVDRLVQGRFSEEMRNNRCPGEMQDAYIFVCTQVPECMMLLPENRRTYFQSAWDTARCKSE